MLPVESEDTLAGVQLTSAVDYPGKLCSTLFLGGCNFRCPFCHNGSLVLDPRGAAISFKEVLTALHRRRGLVDVVTITGGEPTLNPSRLGRLIREIKVSAGDPAGNGHGLTILATTSGFCRYPI